MIGYGAAAMRDDQAQLGEILEQVTFDELHEGGRIGIDVIGASCVEGRIARTRDMDHGRHIELDHLLEERIPVSVVERRRREVATGRVRVQIAADKTHIDAALQLGDRALQSDTR